MDDGLFVSDVAGTASTQETSEVLSGRAERDREYVIRPARTSDVSAVVELMAPLVDQRVLLGKEKVTLFESIQEMLVVEAADSAEVIGCGSLHVMWEDLAEVRTLVVRDDWLRRGVGHAILAALLERSRALGVHRVFCLTFETEFFSRCGFSVVQEPPVEPDVYAELLRSSDEGVAEFLELARVKQNTLGNTRMIIHL